MISYDNSYVISYVLCFKLKVFTTLPVQAAEHIVRAGDRWCAGHCPEPQLDGEGEQRDVSGAGEALQSLDSMYKLCKVVQIMCSYTS